MESEGPRIHRQSVTGLHLGLLQYSPHLDILFIKINQQASHPPKCAWDSSLTSSFHVSRLIFIRTLHIPLCMLHVTRFLLLWYDDSMAIRGAHNEL
jgi:hypothetical protein